MSKLLYFLIIVSHAIFLFWIFSVVNSDIVTPKKFKGLQIFIPQDYRNLIERSVEEYMNIGQANIFLSVMCLNYYLAAITANMEIISDFNCPKDYICIIRDFFVDRQLSENWFVIHDVSLGHTNSNMVNHGLWIINRNLDEPVTEFHSQDLERLQIGINNSNIVYSFLGMSQFLAKPSFTMNKLILIDEIHPNIDISPHESPHHWRAFKKLMEIVKILHENHGFQFHSFVCRNKDHLKIWQSEYPFVQITVMDYPRYEPYLQLLRRSTAYFSHFFETYGFPYYESLQHGLPVILFAEHAPPLVFRHYKNSVICSMLSQNSICADQIVDFFNNYHSVENSKRIVRDSTRLYSAETFGNRLKASFEAKGLISQ